MMACGSSLIVNHLNCMQGPPDRGGSKSGAGGPRLGTCATC